MIAVWFSNGAASAVALKLTLERHGHAAVRAVNNPVAEEDEDNLRFQRDVAVWLGVEIDRVVHPDYPAASADAKGLPLKRLKMPECGIHCEENK